MRYLRTAMAAAALTVAFLVPSAASAQISKVEIARTAQLLPEGATVIVPVTVNCVSGFVGGVAVGLVQSTGNRLVQGGSSTGLFCTGSDQTVGVEVGGSGLGPYKQGKAIANARVFVTDPETGQGFEATAGPQEIHLKR